MGRMWWILMFNILIGTSLSFAADIESMDIKEVTSTLNSTITTSQKQISVLEPNPKSENNKIHQINLFTHQITTTDTVASTSLNKNTKAFISTEPDKIVELNQTGWPWNIVDDFVGYDDYNIFEEYIDSTITATLDKTSLPEPMDIPSNPSTSPLPLFIARLLSKYHMTSVLDKLKDIGTLALEASLRTSTNLPATRSSESIMTNENQQVSVTEELSANIDSSATVELYSTADVFTSVDSVIAKEESMPLTDVNLTNITLLSSVIEQVFNQPQNTPTESTTATSLYGSTEAYISTEPHEIIESNETGWLRSIFDGFGGYDDYVFFEDYDGYGNYGSDDVIYDNDPPVGYGYDHDDVVYEDYRDYRGNNDAAYDDTVVYVYDDDYDEYVEDYPYVGGFGLMWWLR